MRLERRDDGKGELSLRQGSAHVMRAEQLGQLAVWIEELFPDAVSEARKPLAETNVRSDAAGEPAGEAG